MIVSYRPAHDRIRVDVEMKAIGPWAVLGQFGRIVEVGQHGTGNIRVEFPRYAEYSHGFKNA
ncbi:hypothetical protein GCM10010310_63500 [Streptomyces violaceolatus]|uniref:Uncharacterized protein n=1 Tax=Streptomyces violaceolatus TaxID=67378 RepID=A0ABN3TB28_9ACTN